ncbi:MAG: ATP-binding protein [Nitrospinae bacterium]|nr:ATP-binding protein [Nitrospinota bacterium]
MREKLLEAVVREMQMGVVVLDMNKRILYSNPFFEKTFSLNGDLLHGMLTDDITDISLLEAIDKAISSGERQSQEITIEGKVRRIVEVRLVPVPLSGLGTPKGGFKDKQSRFQIQNPKSAIRNSMKVLIGFFQDVTEEKRVEAIKRDFVSNVSHELRTPLASIKGYTETLLDGAIDDKSTLKKFLTIIDRHANRMTTLIDDLLTLSMVESHQMQLKLEVIDIKGLISSVLQGFEKGARDKGLRLIMDIGENLSEVTADRGRLEQVIINLVDNAIKYTNNGEVRIAARREDNTIRVDIEDTGIGIPEKEIPRIFERFYRVDKGRSRELGGTGLGLAIVKHIIQAHRGQISVKSIFRKGTIFSFSLPLSHSP